MSTAHTPGPWTVRKSLAGTQVLHITSAVRETIAAVNSDADARLIAAAPELLAILQDFASSPYIEMHHPKRLGIARAAIAKATGGAP